MRRRQSLPRLFTLGLFVLVSVAPLVQWFAASNVSASLAPLSGFAARQRAPTAYGQLPISFEANQGQADSQVRFLARGPGYRLFLTPTEALLAASANAHTPAALHSRFSPAVADPATLASADPPTLVGMRFLNANPQAEVTGEQLLPGIVNYLLGNDPAEWRTNIPTYAQVRYQNIYPGIDLVFYGNQGQLEYDFIVAPGSNPARVHLGFTGVNHLSLDAQDRLLLRLPDGEVIPESTPHVYQEISGARQEIASRYVLQGATKVGFALGAYDASQPLVIDPMILFSTYLGGLDNDEGTGLAVDGAGNAYITGSASSPNFPTQNPLQPTFGGGFSDAFVTRMNAAGTALVYSTYLGGSGADWGTSIAVDSAGDAYVIGMTFSTDFPTYNALQPTFGGGFDDAFVAELNAAGTALVYSTYLGGSDADWGTGIAVDSMGDAYITGGTSSTNFPTHNALQVTKVGTANAFVAELNATGSALIYSTYLGGSNYDYGAAIAVDGAGDAYVTGITHSSNFPTHNALQSVYAGDADAFVAELNSAGTALVYSTYLGGSGADGGTGIAIDSAGNAYVTGATSSTNFPTRNALQATNAGGDDAFVAKLNAAGSALIYSTYLGGSNDDEADGISVDSAGNVYITGSTSSINFPTRNALQATNAGGADAFVARLNATGSALLCSSYLGGGSNDGGNAIAVENASNVYVTGATASADFPTSNPVQGYGGMEDGFLVKMNLELPAQFQISPGIIALTTTPGSSPSQQTLTLGNTGEAPLNWMANSLPSWVSVSPSSGSVSTGATQTLTLTFNTPSATPQVYTTVLELTDPNASNAPNSLPITVVSAHVSKTWYFAEGYTGGGFSEYLTLANPNSQSAHVSVTYYLQGAAAITRQYVVNPDARSTLLVNNEIGANQNVSMTVTADQPIVAERPMYFRYVSGNTTIPGGSDVLGATQLSQQFDFGYLDSTANHFTWLTILNQNSQAMNVSISYYPATGGAPITVQHQVAANSRGTILVNKDVPLGSYSALVTLDEPGLVERPMYLIDNQTHYTGSADVVGVTQPLTNWYFAEGYTGSTFEERYILSNPNQTPTNATVTFFLSGGTTKQAQVTIPAGGQQVIDANAVLGANVNNSAEAQASQPILAERFISFDYTGQVGTGQSTPISGASDVLGAPSPSNLFYFAEGYSGGLFGEYLTIENPSATQTAFVTVRYLPDNGQAPTVVTYQVAPSSRYTVFTNGVMVNLSFSMVVESNVPIVAERPMYFNYNGITGGSDVVGYQP